MSYFQLATNIIAGGASREKEAVDATEIVASAPDAVDASMTPDDSITMSTQQIEAELAQQMAESYSDVGEPHRTPTPNPQGDQATEERENKVRPKRVIKPSKRFEDIEWEKSAPSATQEQQSITPIQQAWYVFSMLGSPAADKAEPWITAQPSPTPAGFLHYPDSYYLDPSHTDWANDQLQQAADTIPMS